MSRAEDTHTAHDKPVDGICPEYFCPGALLMVAAADVTEDVIDYVVELVDCDYGDSPIDWETVFDRRIEGMTLADGRSLSMGPEYDTPAMRKIQRQVRKIRSQG